MVAVALLGMLSRGCSQVAPSARVSRTSTDMIRDASSTTTSVKLALEPGVSASKVSERDGDSVAEDPKSLRYI